MGSRPENCMAHWHILWGADPRTAWHIAMGSRPENCMAHSHGATISQLSTPYWRLSWGAGPRTAWHIAMGSRPKDCMARSHGATISTLSRLMCSAAGAGTQLTPLLTCREALWGAGPRTAWCDDFDAFTTDVHGRGRRYTTYPLCGTERPAHLTPCLFRGGIFGCKPIWA